MIGHIVGQPIMLMLGSFQFGTSTAAYQELQRSTEYRWASQDRFGQREALQYTGPGGDTINLPGVIYPEWRGGTEQVENMRLLAGGGVPLLMVAGDGKTLGRWVIERVEDRGTVFAAGGVPRKQEFGLQLRKFDDGDIAKQPDAADAEAETEDGPLSTLGEAVSAVSKFAEDAAKTVAGAIAPITDAIAAVQEQAAEIGSALGPVIASAQRGISTARALQAACSDLKQSATGLTSLQGLQSGVFSVMNAASAASTAVSAAAGISKLAGVDIGASGGAPAAVTALRVASASAGKLAVAASRIYSDASSTVKRMVL